MNSNEIKTTHLDAFTLRRDPLTHEITCNAELSLRPDVPILKIRIDIGEYPEILKAACDLAMALHHVTRTSLRGKPVIDFSAPWTK